MTYPSAPWTLQGFSIQSLHLLDIQQVRSLIPSELTIIPVFPGKTLGGVYIASYGVGSNLEYNELIVASGIVYGNGNVGAWITHIYVDNSASVQGGREIWGLPKELAQFSWSNNPLPCVRVRQDDRPLVTLNCQWRSLTLPSLPLVVPVFGRLDSKLLFFSGQGRFNLQLAGLELTVPSESPLSLLGLGQSWLNCCCDPLTLTANVPTVAD